MKKICILFILLSVQSYGQNEFFAVNFHVDPHASIKEKSINFGMELEYSGFFYAKAGFEVLPSLQPSYFDVHGAFGINKYVGVFDQTRIYGGIRLGRIFRENKSRGELFGLESGIDFRLTDNISLGPRFTYDFRNDGIPLGWESYWRANGSAKLTLKF